MTLALSRYACFRVDGGRVVAEGPSGSVRIDAATAAALLEQRAIDDAGLVEALVAAGVLVAAEERARERDSVWAFHDRLFHARTRPADRSDWDASRTPPRALPERSWAPRVDLPRPDLDALEHDDPPLARVQSERTSRRLHAEAPLSLARLGELLFRVGRVVDLWEAGGVEYAPRPYPSAGALYELELYVAADACEGLDRGLYHYAAGDHALADVGAAQEHVERLLADAAAGMGVEPWPQALVVIAARFPRLASKYGPLAYSLMLKNVGVLMQTMYLSATAMGLAACAVGAGDAEVFARATGLAVEDETSVGELALGEPARP